ncbi:MAG TPA: thiol:disulfide interchange protein DsbA/DsbL [Pseudomonadales bacterium]|nr:thiol:disulfide interchange protein DsbA/DsbL [Pseudomonadales bacterium]
MARSEQESKRIRRLRILIGGGLAAAAVVIASIGLYFTLQPVGEIAPGTHYDRLPGADRPRLGDVVVTEYFSYGCVHCRNFDPQIEDWIEDLPAGVRFERVPVAFSAAWRNLAAAYYAAEELGILERNHARLFAAIHDSGLNLMTPQALGQFFDGHGTDAETFRRRMNAPSVRRALDEADRRTAQAGIRAVPTLVVDGRYRISNADLSRQQVLQVADELVADELRARAGG